MTKPPEELARLMDQTVPLIADADVRECFATNRTFRWYERKGFEASYLAAQSHNAELLELLKEARASVVRDTVQQGWPSLYALVSRIDAAIGERGEGVSHMGDVGDDYRAYKSFVRERRDALGAPCAGCMREFPKAPAKVLLPDQRCWRGHVDPRPASIIDEWMRATGRIADGVVRREA